MNLGFGGGEDKHQHPPRTALSPGTVLTKAPFVEINRTYQPHLTPYLGSHQDVRVLNIVFTLEARLMSLRTIA
ncbi:hypothetical protein [Pseudonocardia thermophila]|uniref:hypothetical protein n=1 Tax=Pseudonocardia thermophila TaxID=1848 RepID=UPI00116124BF|nr:hypothetical protein [Pseudonocardia thermophila]